MPPETPPLPGSKNRPAKRRLRAWAGPAALLAVVAAAAGLFIVSSGFRMADSDERTLRGFQIRVLSISQAAAENRMDGALAALQALEKDLDEAALQGRISVSRYRGIDAALDAVRADLTNQLSAGAQAGATTSAVSAAATPTAAPTLAAEAPAVPVPEAPLAVPLPAEPPAGQEAAVPEPAKEARAKGKGADKP